MSHKSSIARRRGVVQRHSTDEAAEQKRATAGGGCGGKAADQGEHARAYLAPDTAPGKRAQRARACAQSSEAEREAEVHGTAAPRKHRPAPGELLQPEEKGSAGSGWGDVGRIWKRPGGTT